MDERILLIALPVAAFIIAWGLASWRAQRGQQQAQIELELARSRLAERAEAFERLQAEFKDVRESEQLAREASSRAQATASKLEEQLVAGRQGFDERLAEREQALNKFEHERTDALVLQRQAAEHLSEARQQLSQARTQLQEKQIECDNYRRWWEEAKGDLKQLNEQHAALDNAHARLTASHEERQQGFDAQFRQLQENRESLTKEFERLANEVLERKGKAFKELSQESIGSLLTPLQTEVTSFRARIEAIHTKDAEQRVELRTELKHLQALNREITDQADKLTNALRGQKKVQGNWGELMLENVLDNSGLQLGRDYKREVSFNTEDGRQRPDAIVYLPQKKHLIIDAKTSLVAYTDFVNAEDDLLRAQALSAHTAAVRDRINELADRDYYRLPELNSPEVVIMFIPIESAYVEALRRDESLFQRAIERNVLVATPTTLLTSLKIVKQLWSFEDRNKHTAELANRALRFYDKLNGFLTSMTAVGTQLDRAKDTYEKALSQLYTGKGNLIKQASEFKELGVSVQRELPGELVERANLELGSPEADAIESNT